MEFEIIKFSVIRNNVAKDNGGGICIYNYNPMMKNLQIVEN